VWDGQKCVYVSCSGTGSFADATLCTGDDTGLTGSTAHSLEDQCTDAKKCEWVCGQGFHRNGDRCEPDDKSILCQ
jgi:hypothetical protein